MILQLKRAPGIYLVGFMGCGKTTVGRLYAERIGWRFVDLDDEIEATQRSSITDLFENRGEAAFRAIETEAIRRNVRKIQSGNPMVVSLGGGAFAQPANVDLLNNNGVTIWIDTAFPVIQQRVAHCVHRPLARDPERFRQLFETRRPAYAKADYRVEITENDSRAAVEDILKLPLLD